MSEPVRLLPMLCPRCQNPLPAKIDEVAWVCTQCGQGMLLDATKGLAPLEVHYSAGIPAGKQGSPYWVAQGQPVLQRKTYQGDKSGDMRSFWAQPRLFFVPAVTLQLEQVVEVGVRLLRQPPTLVAGPVVTFLPVTVPPDDVRALAEFVVFAVEAERKDALKELSIRLDLAAPELWVL